MQLLPLQLRLHPTPAGGKELSGQGGLRERVGGGGGGWGGGAENRGGWVERVTGRGRWPAVEGQ